LRRKRVSREKRAMFYTTREKKSGPTGESIEFKGELPSDVKVHCTEQDFLGVLGGQRGHLVPRF